MKNNLVLFYSGSDMSGQYELIETRADKREIIHFSIDMEIENFLGNANGGTLENFKNKHGYKVILSSLDPYHPELYKVLKNPGLVLIDTDIIYNSIENIF